VPLTLITGPANAAKARAVLDGYRAALARARGADGVPEPLLVVPTAADVDHYRRELAADGAVFGVRVIRFDELLEEVASRAGAGGAPVSDVQRERLAAAATAQADLRALQASALTPGFPRALVRLVSELQELRIAPAQLASGLREWAGGDAGRRRYGAEVAGLYAGYRELLAATGRLDTELHAQAALDGLRLNPRAWGGTPVFVYGFDDLTPLQRDALDTLARPVGADVTVSLAYEAGHPAFDSRATNFQEVLALAGEHIALDAEAEHYAPASREALHHLERRLFAADAHRVAPGSGIELLEGGGERAELELVGARVRRLLDEGIAPEEIAVVLRSPQRRAAQLVEVLGAYGIPHAFERDMPLGHAALGRGLVALLRSALLGGTADDLVTYLRTPGVVHVAEMVDRLEATVRRRGIRTAAAARERWEQDHWELEALDRVGDAAARSPLALLERVEREAGALFAGPWRRGAPVLDDAQRTDARVLATVRSALKELRELAERDASLAPGPAELVALLADLPVTVGERPRPGAVTVSGPLALRARRVRALVLCDLQEGAFPPPPRGEPFFSDDERFRLSQALGKRLTSGEEQLAAERYLFYAAVSRPVERLVLAWHAADDEAKPAVASFFVADVCDLFDDELYSGRARRSLGEAAWPPGEAPTEREAQRTAALRGPRAAPPEVRPLRDPHVLEALAAKPAFSPSSLEAYASCPVRWYVEKLLRPRRFGPDPEAMARGSVAHAVLEGVLQDLSGPLDLASLPRARELLREALARHAAENPISTDAQRQRALVRRLEANLERYLAHAAATPTGLVPTHFEVAFGGDGEDELPAVELEDGELRVQGRIDRVDVGPGGEAVVVDYKSGKAGMPHAKWLAERHFQGVLYLLAVRHVLGLEPAGALYQALGAESLTPRGAVLDSSSAAATAHAKDRLTEEELDVLVAEVVAVALEAVRGIRAGALERRPDTCGYGNTCQYPGFCRWEP
jgi:ATP-dependent helicase/DNAse subunit B